MKDQLAFSVLYTTTSFTLLVKTNLKPVKLQWNHVHRILELLILIKFWVLNKFLILQRTTLEELDVKRYPVKHLHVQSYTYKPYVNLAMVVMFFPVFIANFEHI